MGKNISEIQNDNYYKSIAHRYMKENKLFEAEKNLAKAFELNASTENMFLYVSLLFNLEEYKKSLFIAEKNEEKFYETAENLILFISLLIENKSFMKARRLLDTNEKFLCSVSENKFVLVKQKLFSEQEKMQKKRKEHKMKIKKELASLSTKPLFEQLKWMEEANILSLHELQEVASFVMNNPYVNVLARNSFLAYLIQYNDPNTYQMIWMGDKEKKVCPADFSTLEENKVVITINNLLDQRIDENPSFYQLIKKEMNYHFLYLFPFIDEMIPYPTEWIRLYAEKYDPAQIDERDDLHQKSIAVFESVHLFEMRYNKI